MKKKTWFIVYIVATSLFIFLMYYLTLPALNFGSVGFYFFLALIVSFGLSICFIKRVPYLREKNKGMTYKRRYLDRNGTSHVKIIDADTKFNGVIQSLKAYVITFGSVVVLGSTRVSWHISPLDKGGLLYRLYKEKIPSV